MKRTQKGFTLVELLVVIAILAILATVSVVGYTSFIDRANESNAKTEAHQIEEIIESALMVKSEAQVTSSIKVTKSVSGTTTTYTFASGTTSVEGAYNLSTDLAAFADKLSVGNSGELIYTNNGYAVNVMAGTATKSSNQ